MSNSAISDSMLGMLSYIKEETQRAETIEEVSDILRLLETAISETPTVNTVHGLDNIRVEFTRPKGGSAPNLATTVPDCLVSTFYDLSDKMNQLQDEDPETFANASNALHWLANNDKVVS
ncbi:MAG: hypothetical protein OQK24_08240 [Magnetovibrio sp.]|nr:hypothetical protein [Magnetovibrio sp.]